MASSSEVPRIITWHAWSLSPAFLFPQWIHFFAHFNSSVSFSEVTPLFLCGGHVYVFFFLNPPFVVVLVTKSCPILCNHMGYSPLVSSVHGISPDKNPGVGYQFLLQGIFPPKELNPQILHCRQIHYHWETQKSSRYFSFGNCSSLPPSMWLGEVISGSLPSWWQEWPRDRLSNQRPQLSGN